LAFAFQGLFFALPSPEKHLKMQKAASQLSETAFYLRPDDYRYFSRVIQASENYPKFPIRI
jgi:hypothetical protein